MNSMILPFTLNHSYVRRIIMSFIAILFTSQLVLSQTCFVNPRVHKITANITPAIQSFMEMLPYDYDSTTSKKYPLLVYIGGTGEMFQQPGGTDQDLCPALNYSLPMRFNQGQVPNVITDSAGNK